MIDDELLKRRKAAFEKTVTGAAASIAGAPATAAVNEAGLAAITPSAAQVRASGTDPDEFFQAPGLKEVGSRGVASGEPATKANQWLERARAGVGAIAPHSATDERQRNFDEYGNSFGFSGISSLSLQASPHLREVVAAHGDRIRTGYFDSEEYKKRQPSSTQRNLDIYGTRSGFSGISSVDVQNNPHMREVVSAHADRMSGILPDRKNRKGTPAWKQASRRKRKSNEGEEENYA